jgi:phosphoribosylanthranilate isomerase
MRTRIKVCGLTREQDVAAAVEAGADALGFVLYARSARAVTSRRAAELCKALPPFVQPVLLFVNADVSLVEEALTALPHAMLQFHGDETPEDCARWQRPFMRAARMQPGFDLLDYAQQYSQAQALLLDAHVESYGGAGKVFDWSLLPPSVPTPVVLSGGLTPANVIDGISQVKPWAVDVSSGVEFAKGIKDAAKMHQFCQAVRQADAMRLSSVRP